MGFEFDFFFGCYVLFPLLIQPEQILGIGFCRNAFFCGLLFEGMYFAYCFVIRSLCDVVCASCDYDGRYYFYRSETCLGVFWPKLIYESKAYFGKSLPRTVLLFVTSIAASRFYGIINGMCIRL